MALSSHLISQVAANNKRLTAAALTIKPYFLKFSVFMADRRTCEVIIPDRRVCQSGEALIYHAERMCSRADGRLLYSSAGDDRQHHREHHFSKHGIIFLDAYTIKRNIALMTLISHHQLLGISRRLYWHFYAR